ncbi:MAG: hypothetical protein K2X69_00135 [Silvanigrellaceae bacterium]|nr:hypothetical protein [Silvanigrellaceae bacterium]
MVEYKFSTSLSKRQIIIKVYDSKNSNDISINMNNNLLEDGKYEKKI